MWAGLLIVSERGGSLLIAGFVLAVAGLVWRMLWYRREVLVGWDDECLTIAGRSQQYPLRFREELEELLAALAVGDDSPAARQKAESLCHTEDRKIDE